MVARICSSSDHSDQSLVPYVRVVCHRVIGAEHVGQRAAPDPRSTSEGFASPGRLSTSGTL